MSFIQTFIGRETPTPRNLPPASARGISGAAAARQAATGAFRPSEEPPEHRGVHGPAIPIAPQDALDVRATCPDCVPSSDRTGFRGPTNGQIRHG